MKPVSLAAVALLASAPLSLASVNLSISGDLSASSAPVSNPFNGAHFTLDALFSDGTYQDDGVSTFPAALSDPAHTSITITGASNPAYNGTFSLFPDLGTAYYYPSYAGLYGSPDNEGRLFFAIGATHFIQIGLYAHPTTQGAAVTVGSAISTSDFSNTEVRPTNGDNATTFIFGINNDPDGTGDLAISNGAFTPTTVPEASAPTLLAAGLAAFAIRRRSR